MALNPHLSNEPTSDSTPLTSPSAPLRVLVPAYFHPTPGDEWARLIEASTQVEIIAIVNPLDGPGDTIDQAYANLIAENAETPGLTLIGYIPTDQGSGKVEALYEVIGKWLEFYPQINGFFFDEQAIDATTFEQFYRPLFAAAREALPGALIVSNRGTLCDVAYGGEDGADLVCIHEEDQFSLRRFRLLAPENQAIQSLNFFDELRTEQLPFAPGKLAAWPYAVGHQEFGVSELTQAIAQALELGLGAFYISDYAAANRWKQLPSYWETEVDLLARANVSVSESFSFEEDQQENWTNLDDSLPEITTEAPANNPFIGARLFVDPFSNARRQANIWSAGRPQAAQLINKIGLRSQADWFGGWFPNIQGTVNQRVTQIIAAGALPVLVAYNIPNRDCGGHSGGGATPTTYLNWINAFANGIGNRRAVVILEPDALAHAAPGQQLSLVFWRGPVRH